MRTLAHMDAEELMDELLRLDGLEDYTRADPRRLGLPDAERVTAIKLAFWYDQAGRFGPRRTMYVYAKPLSEPTEDWSIDTGLIRVRKETMKRRLLKRLLKFLPLLLVVLSLAWYAHGQSTCEESGKRLPVTPLKVSDPRNS